MTIRKRLESKIRQIKGMNFKTYLVSALSLFQLGCGTINYHAYDEQARKWRDMETKDGPYNFERVINTLEKNIGNSETTDKSKLGKYTLFLKEWKQKIDKDGWNENIVDEIVSECKNLAKKIPEEEDIWHTYYSFIRFGFKGDCEDIVAFILGTLTTLKCPYSPKMTAYDTLNGGHAALTVKVDEKFKIYEPLTALPVIKADQLFYRKIWEMDMNGIEHNDTKKELSASIN